MKKKLKVRQVKSVIGEPHPMRLVVKKLGLRNPSTEVTVQNTPSFRGIVKKIMHLVAVQEVEG